MAMVVSLLALPALGLVWLAAWVLWPGGAETVDRIGRVINAIKAMRGR